MNDDKDWMDGLVEAAQATQHVSPGDVVWDDSPIDLPDDPDVDSYMAGRRLLREMRSAANLNQTELAEKLGVSQPAIARHERTELSSKTVRTIAEVAAATNWSIELVARHPTSGEIIVPLTPAHR